uniref:AT1G08220-like protein n=1 Tax=Kalanchoe fedtschenkoi TaxID=63787 RepID=A0A7N0RCX7_KALFE
MLRFKRFVQKASSAGHAITSSRKYAPASSALLGPQFQHPALRTSARSLDIYQMGSKEAIEKERARLKDEMNRGYFADINELKEHGGKIAAASKVLIPAAVAVKFPVLEANYPDGTSVKLPVGSETNGADAYSAAVPKASLICLSFRASSQAMVDSWTLPFLDAVADSEQLRAYEVSFIESWFLSLKPMKSLLLRRMKKSNPEGREGPLTRQFVYSFGDQYYFRKELKILNLLTGYAFLVDKFGRIRWQGFGFASPEEVSSLVSCTSLLLEEK